MKTRSPALKISLGTILVFLCSCSTLVVPPTDPSKDSPPVITIDAFPVGGSGTVEQQNVSATSTVNVDTGVNLMFTVSAKNSGGVKTLSVTVTQNGNTLYNVATASAPSTAPATMGQVPNLIAITGTNSNGAGGKTLTVNPVVDPVVVSATATNYTGGPTTIVATYVPVDHNLRGKSQTTTIALVKRPGQNRYEFAFPGPTPAPNGVLEALDGVDTIYLFKQGRSDPSDPNASIWFYQGSSIQSGQMMQLFGSNFPAFPLTISGCENPSVNPDSWPQTARLTVVYHFN